MNKKLKIGVLLDSYLLPAWKYKVIEEITMSDFADISLVIINANGNSITLRQGRNNSPVLSFHLRLDRLIFGSKNDYSTIMNIKALTKDTPEINAVTATKGKLDEFIKDSIDGIRKYNLDIILKFGFRFLAGEILKLPRYGVWSYTMDNYGTEKEGTSGYPEVVMKNPVISSELVILGDGHEVDTIISEAQESTCSYSIHLTRDRMFRRASLFAARVIEGIYRYGDGYLAGFNQKLRKKIGKDRSQLSDLSMAGAARNLAVALKIIAFKIFKKAFYSDPFSWYLIFKIGSSIDPTNIPFSNFKKLQPPKDKFWADPFVIKKDGKYFVFVEEFIYRKNKGHISVLEFDSGGSLLRSLKIIEKPYHMSYPFIFESGNDYYMIPESGGNRTIDLYKCIDFPGSWVFVKTIMSNVNAVDTTLFSYNGKWWLFTIIDAINNTLDGSPELFLFFSDDIMSDTWTSHPYNPVVTDIRSSRPAGKIFIHDNKIFRPSQDCSGRYGEAFNINQVSLLTETEYEEVLIKKVKPDWDRNLKGAHTFNFDRDFMIIDAYSFRRRHLFN